MGRSFGGIARDTLMSPHSLLSFPAKAWKPVRRGFSVQSQPPLEYWIARFRGRWQRHMRHQRALILDPVAVQIVAVCIEPLLGALHRRADLAADAPEPRR